MLLIDFFRYPLSLVAGGLPPAAGASVPARPKPRQGSARACPGGCLHAVIQKIVFKNTHPSENGKGANELLRRKPSISSKYNSVVPRSETAAEGQHCPVLTGTRRGCAKNHSQFTFILFVQLNWVFGAARLKNRMENNPGYPGRLDEKPVLIIPV
jgi:hypothetical protein